MTRPIDDPIIVQIMDRLAVALGTISQANGFYNDVAGVGIEPLAYNKQTTYPQCVIGEDRAEISDANGKGIQNSVVLAVHGFVQTNAQSGYRTAYRLRDDLVRVLRSVSAKTFVNTAGRQLVGKWLVEQPSEVFASDLAAGCLEVVARVSVDFRDFSAPVPGV